MLQWRRSLRSGLNEKHPKHWLYRIKKAGIIAEDFELIRKAPGTITIKKDQIYFPFEHNQGKIICQDDIFDPIITRQGTYTDAVLRENQEDTQYFKNWII